jgi:hypothetical protein
VALYFDGEEGVLGEGHAGHFVGSLANEATFDLLRVTASAGAIFAHLVHPRAVFCVGFAFFLEDIFVIVRRHRRRLAGRTLLVARRAFVPGRERTDALGDVILGARSGDRFRPKADYQPMLTWNGFSSSLWSSSEGLCGPCSTIKRARWRSSSNVMKSPTNPLPRNQISNHHIRRLRQAHEHCKIRPAHRNEQPHITPGHQHDITHKSHPAAALR